MAKKTTQGRLIPQARFLVSPFESSYYCHLFRKVTWQRPPSKLFSSYFYDHLVIQSKTVSRDAEEKILPYVNGDQSLKDSLLISKALIDHHLPFLPLERNHVRRCIKNAIQVIGRENLFATFGHKNNGTRNNFANTIVRTCTIVFRASSFGTCCSESSFEWF